MEGNLTQDALDTNRALESMSDWNDIVMITGTDGSALLTAYPKFAVKALANSDATDGVVFVKTTNDVSEGFVELRIPAGGATGKLPRLSTIGDSGDGTTVSKLVMYLQKIAN